MDAGRQPQGQPQPIEDEDHEARYVRQFVKTEFCRFWPNCRNGDFCHFAHSDEELRARPNLWKTSICANWEQRRCRLKSSKCTFAHGRYELRVTESYRKKSKRQLAAEQSQSSNTMFGEIHSDTAQVETAWLQHVPTRAQPSTLPPPWPVGLVSAGDTWMQNPRDASASSSSMPVRGSTARGCDHAELPAYTGGSAAGSGATGQELDELKVKIERLRAFVADMAIDGVGPRSAHSRSISLENFLSPEQEPLEGSDAIEPQSAAVAGSFSVVPARLYSFEDSRFHAQGAAPPVSSAAPAEGMGTQGRDSAEQLPVRETSAAEEQGAGMNMELPPQQPQEVDADIQHQRHGETGGDEAEIDVIIHMQL